MFSTAVAPIQSTSLVESSKQIPRSPQQPHRRISIVGTIGSGKTTFARKTSRFLSAPHIELDALHWEPDWVEAPDHLFRERVKQSLQGDSWVVDGNYHEVRDIVWGRADTVVWLDYSFTTIIARLTRRTLRRIRTHEKLWNGNQEHIRGLFTRDSVFLWAIRTYRRRRKQYPILLSKPENLHLTVVRLRSPREATEFLSKLEQE
jgi:adenylate kinase family enzyme